MNRKPEWVYTFVVLYEKNTRSIHNCYTTRQKLERQKSIEIKVLAWYRHNNMAALNWLIYYTFFNLYK